jgi:hypothetical protein
METNGNGSGGNAFGDDGGDDDLYAWVLSNHHWIVLEDLHLSVV